jgi:Dolichyl-phosphate-mannose-protein mannosyltransferase
MPRHNSPLSAESPNYWALLLACLGALLALRLLALVMARTDLFFDEAQYWTWSRDLAFGYFSKPPLIAWIIRAATDVCGDVEWCVRAPAPILYAITSVFVFLAGRASDKRQRNRKRGNAPAACQCFPCLLVLPSIDGRAQKKVDGGVFGKKAESETCTNDERGDQAVAPHYAEVARNPTAGCSHSHYRCSC